MAPKIIPTKLPRSFLDQPCLCGSPRPLKACCFSPIDGHIRPPLASLAPPPPVTGYSHPKCYMAPTCDCGQKITAEHYISRAVLDAMGDQVVCSGLPWLPDGETAIFGKNSLTAKVLCDRHNNALSPLDAAATEFFSGLRRIDAQLMQRAWSKKIHIRAIRGEHLELWALKTLLGTVQAGISRSGGERLRDGFELPIDRYCALLHGEAIRPPFGMYLTSALDHRFQLENSVDMAPLTSGPGGEIIGLWMKVAGQDIKFVFKAPQAGFRGLGPDHTYRPSDLNFVSADPVDERLFVLKLGWASAAPASITFIQEPRQLREVG